MAQVIEYLLILASFLFLFSVYERVRTSAERKRAQLVEETRWSEAGLAIERANFERKIDTHEGFPDWLNPKSVHIYKHLVCAWVDELISNPTRDEESRNGVRRELFRYMGALEDKFRNRLEIPTEAAEDPENEFVKLAALADKKVIAIENNLATAMGRLAVHALAMARERPDNDFNSKGDLAPAGYCFVNNELMRKPLGEALPA